MHNKSFFGHLFLALTVALAAGCSSGKQALERGDYETATSKAIERLRDNGDNDKARQTLSQAYPLTLDLYLNTITDLQAKALPFHWEEVAAQYHKINALDDELRRCPACIEVLGTTIRSFAREEADALQNAADERYNAGVMALEYRDRENARKAYDHFARIRQLMPNGFRDVEDKLRESKDLATLRVLVEPIPVLGTRQTEVSQEYFQNKVYEFLRGERISEFVRFYTPDEARTTGLQGPDHIVKMQFDQFNVGNVVIREQVEQLTKDSVVVGQVNVNGTKQNVYGTVKATFKGIQKTVLSDAVLDLQIIDARQNRILRQEKLRGNYTWQHDFGTFQGDERALSTAHRQRTSRSDAPQPAPSELFMRTVQPIQNQLNGILRNFYR